MPEGFFRRRNRQAFAAREAWVATGYAQKLQDEFGGGGQQGQQGQGQDQGQYGGGQDQGYGQDQSGEEQQSEYYE